MPRHAGTYVHLYIATGSINPACSYSFGMQLLPTFTNSFHTACEYQHYFYLSKQGMTLVEKIARGVNVSIFIIILQLWCSWFVTVMSGKKPLHTSLYACILIHLIKLIKTLHYCQKPQCSFSEVAKNMEMRQQLQWMVHHLREVRKITKKAVELIQTTMTTTQSWAPLVP